MNYNCASEPMLVCEAPVCSIGGVVEDTMGTLKELLMAMDDTYNALYGGPMPKPQEKGPEPGCLSALVESVNYQAHMALGAFMDMRKRMVG